MTSGGHCRLKLWHCCRQPRAVNALLPTILKAYQSWPTNSWSWLICLLGADSRGPKEPTYWMMAWTLQREGALYMDIYIYMTSLELWTPQSLHSPCRCIQQLTAGASCHGNDVGCCWHSYSNLLTLQKKQSFHLQQQQQRPFNGLWSGTTRVGR